MAGFNHPCLGLFLNNEQFAINYPLHNWFAIVATSLPNPDLPLYYGLWWCVSAGVLLNCISRSSQYLLLNQGCFITECFINESWTPREDVQIQHPEAAVYSTVVHYWFSLLYINCMWCTATIYWAVLAACRVPLKHTFGRQGWLRACMCILYSFHWNTTPPESLTFCLTCGSLHKSAYLCLCWFI